MTQHRFASNTLRRLLLSEEGADEEPRADAIDVALLFADISGFTALMERHVQRGPVGLEEMTQILNGYFDQIVARVGEHGGDVLAFAGDALTVIWRADDEPDGLAGACTRACQCAVAIQELGPDDRPDVSMRVAICAGPASVLRVGGEAGRRLAFMIGDPLTQLGPTLKLAQPGEAAISSEARAALPRGLADAVTRGRVLRPAAFRARGDARPLAPIELPPDREALAQRYVSEAIRGELLAAPGARPEWIAQFRQISAMFVRLTPPDQGRARWLDDYHELVLDLQRSVVKFGGRVDKVVAEDKGILLLAVWGLPGATHEDDPLRAVQAAVQLRERLSRRSQPVAIGVATGRAYCGLVGGERRSEYTIVGTVVNRAARIMQHAEGVLCDEVTRSAAEERVEFADGRRLAIRGLRAKVVASQPIVVRGALGRRVQAGIELIGRDPEVTRLRAAVAELIVERRGRSVVVVGKAGIGKSRMLEELRTIAVRRGIMVFEAAGDAVEVDAPYNAIRPFVAALLSRPALAAGPASASSTASASISGSDAAAAILTTSSDDLPNVAALVADDPELQERLPLLETILPCGLVDNDFTRALGSEARAGLLHALVATLLRRQTSTHPVLLVLDDVHWFDSASLSLLRALTRSVSEVLFALAVRPGLGAAPEEVEELRREEDTVLLDLAGLDEAGVGAMLSRCLGVRPEGIPAALTAVIREKSEGNPLYIEEIARSLVEQGHVEVVDDACRIVAAGGSLAEISLPGTIQGIVHSRIDQLPAEQHLLLKLACVLGRAFDLAIIRRIYPEGQVPADLDAIVDALVEQGILVRHERHPGLCHFRHTATLEAIYEALLFAHRRELHRAAALAYEGEAAGADHLALLAHHWSRAEDHDKARDYLERAGAHALERFANAEAARLLEQLLARVAADRIEPDRDRAARWREQLCEAYFRAGSMEQSLRHGRAALELLGAPMPGSALGMLLSLWRLIVERNLASVPRSFPRGVADEVRARRLRALKIQRRVTDLFGYLSNVPGFLLSACRELAIADACDQRGAAACAHLMLYFIVVVTPMRRRAEPWIAAALALAEGEPDRALCATAIGRVAVARMQGGDFREAEARMHEARALALAAGDLRVRSEVHALHGLWSMYRGLFAAGERHFEAVGEESDFSGDEQFTAWALIGRAGCMEALGRVDEAARTIGRATIWLEEKAAPTTYIWGQGVRALIAHRAGDPRAAAELVDKVLARLRKEKVLAAYWMLGGIEAICVVAIERLAAAEGAARIALARTARECVKFLALFGRTLPFGAAYAALQQASLARAEGRRDRELAALERCVGLAVELDALHLLEAACARLAALSADAARASAARSKAEDAGRRRALAEPAPTRDIRRVV